MGTRADFYIGLERNPKWIGSLSQDGHPWNIACKILIQINETMFEENVVDFLKLKNGIIKSEGGKWSWPWEDSQMTDYSYFFCRPAHKVYAYSMREKIMFDPLFIMQGEDLDTASVIVPIPKFPKMGRSYGPKAA